MFELFKWFLAGLSLFGVVLNVKQDRRCFAVWAVTNAAWTAVDAWHGIWAQAALQLTYFGLALWGLRAWRAKP